MSLAPDTQHRRRDRLDAIADRFTEMIHDARAAGQLAGREPVSRYAAVTLEGSAESIYAANGNLLVADTTEELAGLLAREVGEGWPSHDRAWDLDGGGTPWATWPSPIGSSSARRPARTAQRLHDRPPPGRAAAVPVRSSPWTGDASRSSHGSAVRAVGESPAHGGRPRSQGARHGERETFPPPPHRGRAGREEGRGPAPDGRRDRGAALR